ncbi:MAG: type II toxin-antitoxin system VapC family toxin [Patescibacteria group bacterium]
MYTLDTNSIIYYLKGEVPVAKIIDELFRTQTTFYASTITELELLSFKNLTDSEIHKINDFLAIVSVIPLDSRIARIAAYLRQQHTIELADSVIAATAIFTGSHLLTRNVDDFEKISHLLLRKI